MPSAAAWSTSPRKDEHDVIGGSARVGDQARDQEGPGPTGCTGKPEGGAPDAYARQDERENPDEASRPDAPNRRRTEQGVDVEGTMKRGVRCELEHVRRDAEASDGDPKQREEAWNWRYGHRSASLAQTGRTLL